MARLIIGVLMLGLSAALVSARAAEVVGPYNVRILEGGIGVDRTVPADWPALAENALWSMQGWVSLNRRIPGTVVLAAIGDSSKSAWRGLKLTDGKLALVLNSGTGSRDIAGPLLDAGRWYAITATYDGRVGHLYVGGSDVGSLTLTTARVAARIELAPPAPFSNGPGPHFGGALAAFTITAAKVSADAFAAPTPNFSLVTFHDVGVGWPLQEKNWRGLLEPQDPWTLPTSKTAPAAPVAQPVLSVEALEIREAGKWVLPRWRLRTAQGLDATGATLSLPPYDDSSWYAARVPGTVLTTLIDRGVYPDPDFGLNNLAIPDSLARQDYWYRSTFPAPPRRAGDRITLTFKGINYAAEVWLNGERLGSIRGAFIRGTFDVGQKLKAQGNVLAVRISPPPHPGFPHEQSLAAGPGENGGAMALDGPTFIATEGWDWIPGIRDRNSGLWQEVELSQSQSLKILDPQVVTHLPLPSVERAAVSILVPIENHAEKTVSAVVKAQFDTVQIEQRVQLAPGVSEVKFTPKDFPALTLSKPRLWWPNGYGEPHLYTLKLAVEAGGVLSDAAAVRFGVRELTYELSLFDHDGRLRRVEFDPAMSQGQKLVDVRHEGIKRTPQGWAESLTPFGETSPAVHPVATESLTPYLVIRVNGVPIAARGGSWGTDDSRKRISRAHLEPFFKLQRAAHLNIIRNWLGQNTEEVFYDLADEYGLLVLNDFWISTQDHQLEPQDPQLFLANARDVISRYRNHPSIAVWFGRNEGVPPPIFNEGLDDLVASLDGTRYYTGSSNSVNLQDSGPYRYQAPEKYFTELAQGFSVEVGSPSLSTLESLRASIPAADLWPLSDTYAYHDWHLGGGNGDVVTFQKALDRQFGVPTGLEDFERKAQMMNYVTFRAIFEGFQAHLWTRNSGRLLWMTHPSWPSNEWQLYSSDYDAGAAYYAAMKACEPLHAQMNLPDFGLAVVNATRTAQPTLTLKWRVLSLKNALLTEGTTQFAAPANATTAVAPLDLKPLLAREGLVVVRLTLSDARGAVLSQNTYWQGVDETSVQRLNQVASQALKLSAVSGHEGQDEVVTVTTENPGPSIAFAAKIGLLGAQHERVLPALYGDNYVTLLPGESQAIKVSIPAGSPAARFIALRGWNVTAQEITLPASR